jgi:hypothetical protein
VGQQADRANSGVGELGSDECRKPCSFALHRQTPIVREWLDFAAETQMGDKVDVGRGHDIQRLYLRRPDPQQIELS